MTGKSSDNFNKNYLQYVKTQDPPTQHFKNCAAAFGVGGLICCIGQFIRYMLEYAGLSGDELAGATSIVLIFLGCFLTGLGGYDRIGFANSVTSPAIEFKTEGWIYGMAAKMFTVAGAIIVFGVFSGVLVGLIYLFV